MSENKRRTNFTCFVTALRLAITAPDEERQRAATELAHEFSELLTEQERSNALDLLENDVEVGLVSKTIHGY